MQLIPPALRPELEKRIAKIQSDLRDAGRDAMLVGSNANVYYLTLRFFRGYIYIPASGNAVWFVMRPSGIDEEKDVVAIRKPEQIPGWLTEHGYGLPSSIELEEGSLTYTETTRLAGAFPEAEIFDATPALRKARMVKTPWEIERMKEDGIHQTEAYRRFTKAYREDMTDVEFQIELERILRLEGCLGYSRTSGNLMEINLGSVISGDNADVPTPYEFAMGGAGVDPALPGGADGTTIRPGTTVMVDMNGAFNGYQTDMTRVWRRGEIPEIAMKAHACSLRILRVLEKEALPGVGCSEIYNRAMDIVKEEGLEKYFMGHRQQVAFIGHGVGIELNEMPVLTPRSRDILEEGMTIAIEPKFVIPGVGAVGAENTYVVTPEGLRNLTPLSEEIAEL